MFVPHLSDSSAFYLMDFPDPLPLATPPASAAPRPMATELSVTDREATRLAREQDVGQRPGTLRVKADALKPRLFLFSYNEQGYTETEYTDRYDGALHERLWLAPATA
jgi:magnesium transporter